MPNNRALTPEEIEQYRAYGRALSQPQEVTHSTHALANILNAISGRMYLDHAGTNEYMNRITRGARNRPPISEPISPMSGGVRPQTSSYPPMGTGSVVEQTSANRPIAQPAQPQRPLAQPSSPVSPFPAPLPEAAVPEFDATVEPEIEPGIDENLAPNQLSPRTAELFQGSDLTGSQKFRQRFNRNPGRFDQYLISKYGVNFVIDLIANPNTPVHELFTRHVGNTPTATQNFFDSLPRNLMGNSPVQITASQWYKAWQDQAQNALGINESEHPMSRLGGPTESTELPATEPAQPLNSPATGISPRATSIPFRRMPDETISPSRNRPPNIRPRSRIAQAGGANAISDTDDALANFDQATQNPTPSANMVAPRIPISNERIRLLESSIAAVESHLSNAGSLSLERLTTLEDNYIKLKDELGKLTAPIEVKTHYGIARYDGRTGELQSFSPEPQQITTPSGSVPATPGRGNRLDIPNIGGPGGPGGANAPIGPNQSSGGQDLRVPQHPFGPVFTDIEQHAQDVEATRKLSDKAVEALNSARESGLQAYEIQSTLDLLRTETERAGRFSEGGAFRGPGAAWVQQAKKLLSNFGIEVSGLDSLPPMEQIEKIITQLGSAATRQLSNRPANFEFQTILNAFPGIATSYEGANLLIDYLQQVQDRAIEIGNLAESLPIAQRGRWNRTLREYYDNNPIIVTIPAGPMLQRLYGINTPIRITTKRVSPTEESNLPPDMYFFRGGELHRGDGNQVQTPSNRRP